MLKSHVAYLNKSCLKLAQNWVTDCPLKHTVSSSGLARFWVFTGGYQRVTFSNILCRVDFTLKMKALRSIKTSITTSRYGITSRIFENAWDLVVFKDSICRSLIMVQRSVTWVLSRAVPFLMFFCRFRFRWSVRGWFGRSRRQALSAAESKDRVFGPPADRLGETIRSPAVPFHTRTCRVGQRT
jgi:hypothetical protein